MDETTPDPGTDDRTPDGGPRPAGGTAPTPELVYLGSEDPPACSGPDQEVTDPGHPPPGERPRLCLDRPREVLAWLPYQLHFWPHESVVFASIRPHEPGAGLGTAGGELGLVARTDLGIIGSAAGGRQVQIGMSRHLQRDGAHRVLCALYTDQPFAAVLRGQGTAGRTLSWWRTTPWAELGHTYLVGPERFRCVDCAEEPCCPHTGTPLEVLRTTEVAAWHVYHGHTYAERREALVPEERAAVPRRKAAAAAARRHLGRRPRYAGADLAAWQRDSAHRWIGLVEQYASTPAAPTAPTTAGRDAGPRRSGRSGPAAAHPEQSASGASPASPTEIGTVLAALSDTWVRDAALLWSGTGQLLGESLREDVIGAVFSGRLLPQPHRVRAAEQTLALLDAHATEAWRAPVLTSRAWLAWWTGDGARANILLERALATDPDYSLAQLLGTALAHGIPPGWARAQRAS